VVSFHDLYLLCPTLPCCAQLSAILQCETPVLRSIKYTQSHGFTCYQDIEASNIRHNRSINRSIDPLLPNQLVRRLKSQASRRLHPLDDSRQRRRVSSFEFRGGRKAQRARISIHTIPNPASKSSVEIHKEEENRAKAFVASENALVCLSETLMR
jgi:hypothetical protein